MRRAPSILVASGLLAVTAFSCGGTTVAADGTSTSTSVAALCAGAPVHNADGTATSVGCAFEQQMVNIGRYGTATAHGATLRDGAGHAIPVTRACAGWLVGTDPQGNDVIVDGATGAVRAHGMFHAGQPMTSLPSTLPAPLAVP